MSRYDYEFDRKPRSSSAAADKIDGAGPVAKVIGSVVAVLVFLILAGALIGACDGGFTSTQGGERAVVRNGGPLDNKKVRQIIEPASSLTWTGLFSDAHKYPASQRFLRISSNADDSESGKADPTQTPTSDGVNVGVNGTLYFELTSDHKVLTDFDTKFGVRKFGEDGLHPYDGDEGFKAWLNEIVAPIAFANARKQVANVSCEELVSSCALVQNQGKAKVSADAGKKNNASIAEIEGNINSGLETQINDTLGGPYIKNVRFQIVSVELPPALNDAIEQAQSAFAEVSKSEARVKSAQNDAEANRVRQRGYADCPTCAEIDARKAIPTGISVWAPGGGSSIAVGAGR